MGVQGRLSLLHRLADVVSSNKDVFPNERLEDIFDHVYMKVSDDRIEAADVLQVVLDVFSGIWPSRLSYEGENLGDVWKHSALEQLEPLAGHIPFHKLSQWLSYSLFEPLEQMGVEVCNLDSMTGLPEYRNGGLFIDTSVIEAKSKELKEPLSADHEAIIEWRAMTVILLDELAQFMRKEYTPLAEWPLAKFLQGGTWSAGRKLAKGLRNDGGPPLNIISDGTVF